MNWVNKWLASNRTWQHFEGQLQASGCYSEQLGTQPVVPRCVRSSMIGTKSRHRQNLLQRPTLLCLSFREKFKQVWKSFPGVSSYQKKLVSRKKILWVDNFCFFENFFSDQLFFLVSKKNFYFVFLGVSKNFLFQEDPAF